MVFCGKIPLPAIRCRLLSASDMGHKQLRNAVVFLIAAAMALIISQTGSYLINSKLAIGESYVVNSILHLTHIRNIGGTFGAFPGHSAGTDSPAAA